MPKNSVLYGILGLDRKNIQLLSLIELVVFAALSIGLGLILGVIFHAASFAILLKLIQYDIGIKYSFQFGSIIAVLLTMVAIFVLVFFLNAAKIYMSRPLELLKEKKKRGEERPRRYNSCYYRSRTSRVCILYVTIHRVTG